MFISPPRITPPNTNLKKRWLWESGNRLDVEYGIPSTGDSIVIDMSIIRHGDSAIDKRIIRDKTKD